MQNKLRESWRVGAGGVNAWLAIPSPVTAELVGEHDFDSITIDLQHGFADCGDASRMLQVLASSLATPMARVP